ncbi:hypothetical protein ACWCPQ_02020 [Nocardia sp. NPDC001965]
MSASSAPHEVTQRIRKAAELVDALFTLFDIRYTMVGATLREACRDGAFLRHQAIELAVLSEEIEVVAGPGAHMLAARGLRIVDFGGYLGVLEGMSPPYTAVPVAELARATPLVRISVLAGAGDGVVTDGTLPHDDGPGPVFDRTDLDRLCRRSCGPLSLSSVGDDAAAQYLDRRYGTAWRRRAPRECRLH